MKNCCCLSVSKKKYLFLLALIFAIKFLSCFYLLQLTKCYHPEVVVGLLAEKSGDATAYLNPIDNYINEGEYYIQYGERKVSMGRAPYYGLVYFFFRQFFSQHLAYDFVVVFQILLESISVIYLSLLAQKLLKSKMAFWTTFILMAVSLNSTVFSNYLITESLSISIAIIFCYYFFLFFTSEKKNDLIITGILLSFLVVLKPYFGLLYIFCCIGLFLKTQKNILLFSKQVLLLAFPLIVLTAPYTIRNFIRFKRIQPFSEMYAGYGYTSADFAYRNFLTAWGGSFIFWDKRSAGCYFEPKPDLPCEFVFPEYAFCKGYDMNDIERVRDLYVHYQHNPTKSSEDSVTAAFDKLTTLYKQYRPFRYYIVSRIVLVKEFLFHSGSYYLPIKKDSACYHSYQWAIKLSQSFLYYFSLFIGLLGLLYLFICNKKTYMLLLIPLFLILFFPIVLRATEFRYFAPSYPFLILGTVSVIHALIKKLKKIYSAS